MDDRVPEHGDSHASSSHEVSLEPTPTRCVDLGEHSVETHFPKDRNLPDLSEDQDYSGFVQKTQWREPYLMQKILVT